MVAKYFNRQQTGFSLIELLVGLVIGLFATLAVMQTFSVFEGQKRSTSGTADAQTNGAIALMHLKRSLDTAGFGLPMPNADFDNNILRCTTPNMDIYPVEIEQGTGENGSDKVIVRYSTSGAGAVPINIVNPSNPTISPGMLVSNNIGCGSDLEMSNATYKAKYKVTGDAITNNNTVNQVMIISNDVCGFADIAQQPTNDTTGDENSYIRIDSVPAVLDPLSVGDPNNLPKLACMGGWGSNTYEISNNELLLNGDPIVSGVVNMQAQYGTSNTPGDNEVLPAGWVEPDGTWAAPVAPVRNRIKAIRVALVLKNGLKEKSDVTPVAPKAWMDTGTTTVDIDVSAADPLFWKRYRYRVVSTVVPLKNVLWSWEAVK
ncbi:MAG: type IV pilus assembly protein PilW [Methylophilaceae bacterium]|jgi:type IV pilus assembly protein PilW